MDFLSNGFQQLFAELEDDSQNLEEQQISYNSNYNCDDYYSYVDNQQPPDLDNIFLSNDIIVHSSLETSTSSIITTTTDDFYWNTLSESYDYFQSSTITPPSSELDWENQFLENYIEIPDSINLLPERTPLCSDSCDLFLKESSENLNKFRRPETDEFNSNFESVIDCESNVKITFPCTWDTCNKVYAKPAHLKAHLRRHLGDKPYICNWPNCTWRFSRSDELARHKRSHSGIKPFKCIYCPKCFARSDHLAKHRKVHERKMAASKLKGIYIPNLHQVRPGRKPKNSPIF